MAAEVGIRRRVASISRMNLDHDYFSSGNLDHWHVDIEGACAELAFAKSLGFFWDGSVNTGKSPDVAGYQVRYTHRDNGCLIVRERDRAEDWFVLVTGRHPVYTIRGKISGAEAKQKKYLRDPNQRNPAWFVPQSALAEMERNHKNRDDETT